MRWFWLYPRARRVWNKCVRAPLRHVGCRLRWQRNRFLPDGDYRKIEETFWVSQNPKYDPVLENGPFKTEAEAFAAGRHIYGGEAFTLIRAHRWPVVFSALFDKHEFERWVVQEGDNHPERMWWGEDGEGFGWDDLPEYQKENLIENIRDAMRDWNKRVGPIYPFGLEIVTSTRYPDEETGK